MEFDMADMNRMLDNLAVVTNNPAFGGGSALLYTECSELIRLMNILRDKGMVYLADLLQKLRDENRSVTPQEWEKLHEFEAATPPREPIDAGSRPDQGLPGGKPPSPGQGLPTPPSRPDQGLPGAPDRPNQGLPEAPSHPDQGLPGKPGKPNKPDQGLPEDPDRVDNELPETPDPKRRK